MENSNDCLFCRPDIILDGLLGETENFYVRVAMAGAMAPGHLLVISKPHLSCFGAMPESLDSEYTALLERIRQVVTENFSNPIGMEQGIHGQSVFHAHTHFIPSKSDRAGYDFTEGPTFISHVPSQVRYERGKGIEDVRRIFQQDGQYVTIEQNGDLYICRTLGYDGSLKPGRQFISEATHRPELLNWKTLSPEEKEENKGWVVETLEALTGKF